METTIDDLYLVSKHFYTLYYPFYKRFNDDVIYLMNKIKKFSYILDTTAGRRGRTGYVNRREYITIFVYDLKKFFLFNIENNVAEADITLQKIGYLRPKDFQRVRSKVSLKKKNINLYNIADFYSYEYNMFAVTGKYFFLNNKDV